MSDEMTIKDVLKPRVEMDTIAEILDSIKSAVETNNKCDDVNVGMRMWNIVKQMDTFFKYISMERQNYACLSI